jgi:hypothetical protein
MTMIEGENEMNTFMNNLNKATNFTTTENGALAHKTTGSKVYDMFAFGGAYRNRSVEDCVLLFKNAFEENQDLALKCRFYMRDVRGGQGERRFFRECFKWLCAEYPEVAKKNLHHVPEFGRWDDLLYGTSNAIFFTALALIKRQLALDVQCMTPSLLAKWLPSENASSQSTKKMGNIVRKYLNLSHREYRKMLSSLRERINIVEKLMSENKWDEIEFDKIPSKAGLIYRNAFARNDIIGERYRLFIESKNTVVNTGTLYPYEIVGKVIESMSYRSLKKLDPVDRVALEKYWNNLPDYLKGKPCKMMCVVDTSGSMTCGNPAPIDVAISLGVYCAERIGGDFKNHFISFSHNPQLIKIEGVDFCHKVQNIYNRNEIANTDLIKTFNLVLDMARKSNPEDIPETIVVISDLQIDQNSYWRDTYQAKTDMELMREKWERFGLKMPKLVYWNVNARKETILDDGPNVSYVSGCSPILFEQIVRGMTGIDLMFEKLMSERYAVISA